MFVEGPYQHRYKMVKHFFGFIRNFPYDFGFIRQFSLSGDVIEKVFRELFKYFPNDSMMI